MLTTREIEAYLYFRRVGNGASRALFLARAEAWAKAAGIAAEWEFDSDPDYSWMDAETFRDWRAGNTCLAQCVVMHEGTGVVSGLSGIHLKGFDPWCNDPYCREVEAELAAEIREEVTAAIADAEAFPC